MWILIALFIFFGLIAFHGEVRTSLSPGLHSIGRLVDHLDRLSLEVLAAIRGWIARAEKPGPLGMLIGFVVIGAEVPINFADYKVLRMSLGLVWPTDIRLGWIAFSVIAITAITGLLLHGLEGAASKVVFLAIAVALISFQATVAWLRTSQLDEIRKIEIALAAPADNGGALEIAGQPTAVAEPARQPRVSLTDRLQDNLPADLSALLALLLSAGSIAAAWGGVRLAQGGIVWLACFPFLASAWLVYAAVHAVAELRIHEFLERTAFAVLGALADIHGEIVRTVRRAMPPSWTAESCAWKIAREERRYQIEAQQRANAEVGKTAAAVRDDLDQMQRAASRELVDVQSKYRPNIFLEVAERAATKAKEQIDDLASKMVSQWIAAVLRMFRLDGKLTESVTGEPRGPVDGQGGK